tara:strand:- start:2369 stop:2851 length:483 start_codon:yes stop_codon:yes gene_type:complete
MKYESFMRKLKKRLGSDIEVTTGKPPSERWTSRKEWLVHGDTVASWHVNDDKSVSLFHTCPAGLESDPHTDYYPGTFWSNATQLIDRLAPPPPKYPAGSLVIGKQNKRAQRQGYAGAVGLVTSASDKYIKINFIGKDVGLLNSAGWRGMHFPERDFELVK